MKRIVNGCRWLSARASFVLNFIHKCKSSHPSPNQILLYCQWRPGIYSLNIGIRLCLGLCRDGCYGGDSVPNFKKLCKNYSSSDQLVFIGHSGSNAFYLYSATSGGPKWHPSLMRIGMHGRGVPPVGNVRALQFCKWWKWTKMASSCWELTCIGITVVFKKTLSNKWQFFHLKCYI